MDKASKIFIAGRYGMVGSAIERSLRTQGYTNIIGESRRSVNLEDGFHVNQFFAEERPEYVFLAAAKVGGIHANNTLPGEFIYSNLAIQTNVLDEARKWGVKKLLFLGSSCIYPREAEQPIKESALLTGPLEPTNEAYAIAKIAGIKMCEAYNKQYSTNFITCMPTNLYGPGDNYDLQNAHVLPALMRKISDAQILGAETFTIWGTGKPLREFLYVDDLARACVYLMNNYNENTTINIGSGEEHSISDLAEHICEVIGYRGKVVFDAGKPDGTPRKLLDSSRIRALGWRPLYTLPDGLMKTYQDYLMGQVRGNRGMHVA